MKDNLYEELRTLIEQLKNSVKVLKNNGITLANREREYKELLRVETIRLKEQEGTPATLIDKLVYGEPTVAEKREQRDIAEATYKANLEGINSVKLQIKVVEELINKDLGSKNKDEEN